MSHFDRTTPTLDEHTKPKTVGARLADFGDRLARTFTVTERPGFYLSPEPTDGEFQFPADAEQPWERIASRFPLAREGYDRTAVDDYISDLEHALDEARTSASTSAAVAQEIDRIGEQTSTILRAAHEQAQEITRRAKAQADRCIAEAASRSMAMTQQAETRLRELDVETDAIWTERAQLVEDVRSLATSLTKLAEESARRFPPEPEKPVLQVPPVSDTPTISISRLGGEDEPHDSEVGDG